MAIRGFGLALMVVLLVTSGCRGQDGATHSPPTETAAPVTSLAYGPIWVLDAMNGSPVIAGTRLTLSMGENGYGGSDGCNRFALATEEGAPAVRDDGSIAFAQPGTTLALCPRPKGIMTQADVYLQTLSRGRSIRIQGDLLEILDQEGEVRLVFVNMAPLYGSPEDLPGTAWRLLSDRPDTIGVAAPTLAFWSDGFLGGTASYYGYVAEYEKYGTHPIVRSISLTGSDDIHPNRVLGPRYLRFIKDLRDTSGHSVYQEGGDRRLRIRTDSGDALDFEELRPVVDSISGAEWHLISFIEVRYEEARAGGPPCPENVFPGTQIVARFTETSVRGTAGHREYGHDGLHLFEAGAEEEYGVDSDDGDILSARGRCPRVQGQGNELDIAAQEGRYLAILPELTRYMIFGDRLAVLTNSKQVLLFEMGRPTSASP